MLKEIYCLDSAKKDLLKFPEIVRTEVAYALHIAQRWGKHCSFKPLKQFLGIGVFEIVEDLNSIHRLVYTLNLGECIYVLHAFQKKASQSIEITGKEIDLIKSRIKIAEQNHKSKINPHSGNIFMGLNVSYPEETLIKAELAYKIKRTVDGKKLSLTETVSILGLNQQQASDLMRGRLKRFSLYRLIHFLNLLDCDIDILVKRKKIKTSQGITYVIAG